jgi:predicted 3-demethylubiquinone-9 3-methyltransferase (glyoxalase superfamily)
MPTIAKLSPCLWFDHRAEEAANFYVQIFENSKIGKITHYTEAGREVHKQRPGTVLAIEFELDGHAFTALNAGPEFHFTEAISFQVWCRSQDEIDYFWDRLGAGGDEQARQCGWLKDRFGVSWQIVPLELTDMLADPDRDRANHAMAAMMSMKKLDLAALQHAYAQR